MLNRTIPICIEPGGVPEIIYVSQYDEGFQTYEFVPYVNNGTLSIPTNATVTLEGTKPDGYAFIHNCTYNSSTGHITYTVQDQLAAKAGRVWSKLVIRDTSGNVLGFRAIVWIVDYAGVKDGAVVSDSDLSALEEFVNEFGTINAYKAALDGAMAAVGGPYVASTVAQMTDRTKVYVYTGSETGYTAGHWYYWNGSAWTDGGVYQAAAVETDKTLTVEDMAADAKKTGDEITELKNDLINISGILPLDFSDGYIATSPSVGQIASLTRGNMNGVASAYAPVNEGDIVSVKCLPRDNGATRWYMFVDTELKVISKAPVGATAIETELIAPQNGYVIVNALTSQQYFAAIGTADLSGKIHENTSDINALTQSILGENVYLTFEEGYIRTLAVGETASFQRTTLSNIQSAYMACQSGDEFIISGLPRDNGATRYYMLLDSNMVCLSKAGVGADYISNERIVASEDGYIVVNFLASQDYSAYKVVNSLKSTVEQMVQTVTDLDETVNDMAQTYVGFGNLKHKLSDVLAPESMTWVDDVLVTAFPSDVQSSESQTARIYLYDFSNGTDHAWTSRKWFAHNWGHLNTIDYNPVNDTLVTTNGGQGVENNDDPNHNGHIYLFPKFSEFIASVQHNSTVNMEDYAVTVEGVTYNVIDITLEHSSETWANDAKYQAVWAEDAIDTSGNMVCDQILLVSAEYGNSNHCINKIRKMNLGITDGVFDGTYNILNEFSCDSTDGDFVQDMCLNNGCLYINVGETYTELWKCKLNYSNNNVTVEKHRRNMPKTSGNRWRTGLAVIDDDFTVGYSSAYIWRENIV